MVSILSHSVVAVLKCQQTRIGCTIDDDGSRSPWTEETQKKHKQRILSVGLACTPYLLHATNSCTMRLAGYPDPLSNFMMGHVCNKFTNQTTLVDAIDGGGAHCASKIKLFRSGVLEQKEMFITFCFDVQTRARRLHGMDGFTVHTFFFSAHECRKISSK